VVAFEDVVQFESELKPEAVRVVARFRVQVTYLRASPPGAPLIGPNRTDRANAPLRCPVLRPTDLRHDTHREGTYQEIPGEWVFIPEVYRILIRQVIVG
jgi:hypothetical protein